jgi:hypothetical protein
MEWGRNNDNIKIIDRGASEIGGTKHKSKKNL